MKKVVIAGPSLCVWIHRLDSKTKMPAEEGFERDKAHMSTHRKCDIG